MRTLIDYIRSLFCNHEYECIDMSNVYTTYGTYIPKRPSYRQWTYVCKKCGRKKKITTE